ncbi:hypothetical protein Pan241w_31130 [Gimesia alba]|uniref:Uncharacterized protein n=1 Tax=Gimesia alba TaxID=2527973 RepID=A0A517RGK9_9PLAN|nr:hypothetical protein Pan241w_31130 [Gimesia alba]
MQKMAEVSINPNNYETLQAWDETIYSRPKPSP